MSSTQVSRPGASHGHKHAGNFREVTRCINGGYNGLANREKYYRRALNVLA